MRKVIECDEYENSSKLGWLLLDISGKAKVPAGAKRNASPTELHASKRGRTSAERRGSFDSFSSISDSSLDRTGDKDDDVILVRSRSGSMSPRNNMLVLIIICPIIINDARTKHHIVQLSRKKIK